MAMSFGARPTRIGPAGFTLQRGAPSATAGTPSPGQPQPAWPYWGAVSPAENRLLRVLNRRTVSSPPLTIQRRSPADAIPEGPDPAPATEIGSSSRPEA